MPAAGDSGISDSVQNEQPIDEEVVETTMFTTSTNTADDYAHRGAALQTMPFYVYRMRVLRHSRQSLAAAAGPNCFEFDSHYALANTYVQVVMLCRTDVPTIDGFQCPTWQQDAEQNALLKHILFTPWMCDGALNCGSVHKFSHMLSNCSCTREMDAKDAQVSEICAREHKRFLQKWY